MVIKNNQYQKIVPFILFILGLFLLFKLIEPMITILLSSILLAYMSFPLYQKILTKITNQSISIILSLFIVIILITIPFAFLTFEISQEGYSFYNSFSDKIQKGELFGIGCNSADSKFCLLINEIEVINSENFKGFGFDDKFHKIQIFLEDKIKELILNMPILIAKIFLTLVISYFILKDWKIFLKNIIQIISMERKTKNRLILDFGNIAYTVIYAELFVAFVQGIIATIGFYIFGVPFPIIFGLLLAFCALIPAIGTAIIWMPASLFLIFSGYYSLDYWVLISGIALFFYGLLIISTIDNLLLAKIVHAKTKVNQIIVIIGVIGGVSMFGFIGIFIGPILLPLLLTYFETFKERYD